MFPRAIWHRSVLSFFESHTSTARSFVPVPALWILSSWILPRPRMCAFTALSPPPLTFKRYNLMKLHPYDEGLGMKKKAIFGEGWEYSAWKSNPYSHRLGVGACVFSFYFQAPPAFWFDSFMCRWRTLYRLPCRYCVKLMRKPVCLRGEVF